MPDDFYAMLYIAIKAAVSMIAGFMILAGADLTMYISAYCISALASYTFIVQDINTLDRFACILTCTMTVLYVVLTNFSGYLVSWFLYILLSFVTELVGFLPCTLSEDQTATA